MRKIIKAHPFAVLPAMFAAVLLGGCASNMNKYYTDLTSKITAGNYEAASKLVEKSESKYGKKNILLFYLDGGMSHHLAENYEKSTKNFELAKIKFEEYYQKSVTAGAASMVFNDSTMPYYGKDFERIHIGVFAALNFIMRFDANSSAVEARQINNLFNIYAAEKNYKNFYGDDGFIRYFMGLVYENAGYLNDAHVSYYRALKAYKNGISELRAPEDLINDAYTTALLMEMPDRAAEIKKEFPNARRKSIPRGHGELIIVNYNGLMPRKIDNVLEFALFSIWPYVNQVEVSTDEQAEFEKAKSITISAFTNDYIKIVFPKYERIPNKIKAFSARYGNEKASGSYEAQNLAEIAEKCLKDDIGKIYAKTLARAAIKYVIGKTASKAVDDSTGNKGLGVLTQVGFNVFNSLTASADKRGWRTLPENILMTRIYLPAGENDVTVDYLDSGGQKLRSETFTVNIEDGKKTFKILRSLM
ncbi:MAG: hypothetical protein FWH43_06130 [Endomicrobia bacterium]|nr:hypothetical protein [Endomicrobiia bacterium]